MITVIAGVNGAGKSSIAGAYIRNVGGDYYNPDECARRLMTESRELSQEEANAQAWAMGRDLLQRAVASRRSFAMETTLGGGTLTEILMQALAAGVPVRLVYCGLTSPELHIERVAARVKKGGHAIPEAKIRERWERSARNAMRLIAAGADAVVFDNSAPLHAGRPVPKVLFRLVDGRLSGLAEDIPIWARPLATAALRRLGGLQGS